MTPLAEAVCTCRSSGQCETCLRWRDKFAEIMARIKDRAVEAGKDADRQPALEQWARKSKKAAAWRRYKAGKDGGDVR